VSVRGDVAAAGTTDESRVARLGGAAAMAGAAVILVGNLLHPRTTDFDGVEAELKLASDSGIWLFDHFLIAWGVALAFVGLMAITSYLDRGAGSTAARIARASAVGGVIVAYIAVSVDGMALKEVADNWAAAGGSESTLAAGDAVANVSLALFTALIGSLTGLTPLLVGTAQLWSKRFDAWVCYLGIAGGAVCLLVASIQFLAGPSNLVTNLLFSIGSLLVTVWLFMSGRHLWKMSPATG
jgi:hypothetical protein